MAVNRNLGVLAVAAASLLLWEPAIGQRGGTGTPAPPSTARTSIGLGIVLVVIGLILLGANIGLVQWSVIWPSVLIILGVLVSVLGQLGDLMLSSIKRDVGVKDTGAVIPGHGGLLDRFDSLVLVPPAVFHYLSLFLGPLGAGQAERILTGG